MVSYKFPILYSLNANGKVKHWTIRIEGKTEKDPANIITEYGQQDGKMTTTEKLIETGKNIGRSNETTPFQQAKSEANAKWNKQKDKGYIENKGDLETQVHVSPMLAKKYEDDGSKIKYPAMVQRKYDGVRCVAYLDEEGNVQLMSRTGKPWHFFENIRAEILKAKFFETAVKTLGLKDKTSFYIDGELYTDKVPFEQLVGICRKEKNLTPEEEKEAKLMEYHIYDCWSLEDKKLEFGARNELLGNIFNSAKKLKNLVLVPTYTVTNEKEMMKYYNQFLDEKYEGIMIRNISSPYKMGPTRSNDLQKYKPIDTEEFKIVGFENSKGTEKDAVKWVCEIKNGSTFGVRPEGTIESRKKMFKEAKKYIGKLLTVEFQGYTVDGMPRFPRGVAIRDYE